LRRLAVSAAATSRESTSGTAGAGERPATLMGRQTARIGMALDALRAAVVEGVDVCGVVDVKEGAMTRF